VKNISAWAIRHPLPPIVLFVVLLFMGVVSFLRLPVTADPDVSFPAVFVIIAQPGAAPQELEKQVMQQVEGAVAGIGNIDNITSWAAPRSTARSRTCAMRSRRFGCNCPRASRSPSSSVSMWMADRWRPTR
jgi:Cu/Ag efflux pump CusA